MGAVFEPGKAIADYVRTGLAKYPRWNLLERHEIGDSFDEMDLGESGEVASESAVERGMLLGAEYQVKGAVIDFQLVNRGSSIGAGVNTSGGRLSGGHKGGGVVRVSVQARIVHVPTGTYVATASCIRDITIDSGGFDAAFKSFAIGRGGGELKDSGLSKGMSEVGFDIARQLGTCPLRPVKARPSFEGYVVDVDSSSVFINLGKADGVKKRTIFVVARPFVVKDPRSGRTRRGTKEVGHIIVTSVGDMCECKMLRGCGSIKPNDVVTAK